jgi:HEPN domain-containing protein
VVEPLWDPNADGIAYLVRSGRLEHVAPSPERAQFLVAEARRHLTSAQALAATADTSLAFLAAYDAARKALTAVLAVQGLRASGGDGGHAVLLDAVRPQFPEHKTVLQAFDWMRATRNATEYPDADRPTATRQDVAEAVPEATGIVDLVEGFLGARSVG